MKRICLFVHVTSYLLEVLPYVPGLCNICGDFNGRCGYEPDFIEGVDTVPERDVLDKKRNGHGSQLLDFLKISACCMLNGRAGSVDENDFTSLSGKGETVVDYALLPHEKLQSFSDFKVWRTRRIFEVVDGLGQFDPAVIPDHSLLCWVMHTPSATRKENVTEDSVQFTKCNRKNITSELLQSAHIREHIDNLLMTYSDGAHQLL